MTNTERLQAAAVKLMRARKATRTTARALGAYLNSSMRYEDDNDPQVAHLPPDHKRGACGLGHQGGDGEPILCDVCLGAEPYRAARRKASSEHGAALREIIRIGKLLAKESA